MSNINKNAVLNPFTHLNAEVDTLKANLTDSITATQNDLIARADQLAQDVTDITQQLDQDKAAFTQEIQDALLYLEQAESVASALRTPRKIQGVDFDGTQDISLPVFTTQTDGLVPKRVGATSTKYLREDGTWVTPPNTTYGSLTQANAEAGTSTTGNTISAKVLKDAIQYHAPTVTTITGNAGTASKLQTSRTISLTGGVTGSVSFDGSADASIATTVTGLGVANGIATLDSSGQVPSTQLPSYVDDVLEYLNVAAFPTTGVAGKIYVETTGNTTYRWSGTGYVKITSGEVSSVAGKTGVVTLSKADVGLDNVDNTPDAQKPISAATQLALNDKVDKVTGKGLSTIDYTHNDKNKVDNIVTDGDGTKYLSDDGTYKEVSSGGVTEEQVNGWISEKVATASSFPISVATHSDAVSVGGTSGGNNSIQIGSGATAKENSLSIGYQASSNGIHAVSLGYVANSQASFGTCIGSRATAQRYSTAIGYRAINSNLQHSNCVLLGSNTDVTSANQVQLGDSQTTTYAYGAVQDRSDIRDKTDIRDIELGLDFINALRPVEYRWDYREDYFADVAPQRDDFEDEETYIQALEQARADFFKNPVKDGSKTRTRHHTGLIAQEVKQVMDDLGVDFGGFQHHQEKGGLDVMSLGYNELIAVLIKAVQDLSAKVELLENGILPSNTD